MGNSFFSEEEVKKLFNYDPEKLQEIDKTFASNKEQGAKKINGTFGDSSKPNSSIRFSAPSKKIDKPNYIQSWLYPRLFLSTCFIGLCPYLGIKERNNPGYVSSWAHRLGTVFTGSWITNKQKRGI